MMAKNPTLPSSQVESLLYSTATDLGAVGRDSVFGYGRVNALGAVSAAANAVSTVDSQPPTASVTSPTANVTVSGVVPVSLNSADNVGVTRVDLKVNGSTVASDTAAPFAFSWDSAKAANGSATLAVVAFDAAGNSAASSGVVVNVANVTVADTTPPTIGISNPVNGSTVSGSVSIKASAADNNGAAGITQTLLINGKQVATASGGALSYAWNTRKLAAGSYTIQAVARDPAGNSTSQTITVKR